MFYKKMKKLKFLLIMILFLVPLRAYATKLVVQTTAPLISFQQARGNGIGLGIEGRYFKFNLFYIQYSDWSPDDSIIDIGEQDWLKTGSGGRWVRTRWGRLIELNYRIPNKRANLYLGANYLSLQDYEKFGYQLGVEKWIDELAFIRIGFQRVGEANSLFINVGFDLPAVVNKAKEQLNDKI